METITAGEIVTTDTPPLAVEAPAEHRYARQMGLISPEKLAEVRVNLIGCGSIGSFTASTLARMGVKKFHVWDADSVENHNLSNQDFPTSSLGKKKVIALVERLKEIDPDVEVVAKDINWEETQAFRSGVVIAAVDSLAVRRLIWPVVKLNTKFPLYIDPRMGALYGNIFAFDPCQRVVFKDYEEQLTDEGVAALPCTARTIVFNVQGIAAAVGAIIARFVNGKSVQYETRLDFMNLSTKTKALVET